MICVVQAILFDLTGFGISNWVNKAVFYNYVPFFFFPCTDDELQDFPPVKFIVETFQNYYPESLGAMIFYNPPWIFSGSFSHCFQYLLRSVT